MGTEEWRTQKLRSEHKGGFGVVPGAIKQEDLRSRKSGNNKVIEGDFAQNSPTTIAKYRAV